MAATVEARSANAQPPIACDVAVLGGGIAGLAAAIHLRRRGLRVVCIEPERFPHARVGESLDWSSPAHLASLGVPGDSLIADRFATYKKGIQIVSNDRPPYQAEVVPWLSRRPIGFNIVTLHVDRAEMDRRLFERATELGTELLWDRVARVETAGERVVAVETAGGQRVAAPWFLDASGRMARLLLRTFDIPKVDYGCEKVCFWTYFASPPLCEGTTFYADTASADYLTWIWEIPISPQTVSIGCVMPAERVAGRRRQGGTIRDVLAEQLLRFPRFRPLIEEQPDFPVRSVAYRSFVAERACGPNWLILGEAASLPDPLTANGVTAAFRHAEEGVAFLADSFARGELTARQRRIYDTNLKRMGHAFNHSIEGAIYDWPIRFGLGVMPAQRVYTTFAFVVNALYSKYRPQGRPSMLIFGILLRGVRLWIDSWSLLGRIAVRAGFHRTPEPLQATTG